VVFCLVFQNKKDMRTIIKKIILSNGSKTSLLDSLRHEVEEEKLEETEKRWHLEFSEKQGVFHQDSKFKNPLLDWVYLGFFTDAFCDIFCKHIYDSYENPTLETVKRELKSFLV
jgi:hypothetical protein